MTSTVAPAVDASTPEYTAPDFFIRHVDLEFDIHDGETFVTSTMQVERNGMHTHPLVLDGTNLETLDVALDGLSLAKEHGYQLADETLTVPTLDNNFTVKTRVRLKPEDNTSGEGLYKSGDLWCTQCEATGFRAITWFLDRPDNLATYKVKITADQKFPVLLSNRNKVDEGQTADGRHYAVWEDTSPKPSYLFALVAGDLPYIESVFTTMPQPGYENGRDVTLRVYAEAKDMDKLSFAMESLRNAMRWDEKAYRRPFIGDQYNIVAVSSFNAGAMENSTLNIFNTKYVLAHPRTQTDAEFADVEGVIGHEYFHEWSGNKVTVREWRDLSLKEGLTVFRDQEFSAAMGVPAIKRIKDVIDLRNRQFKEDAGAQAHSVRPVGPYNPDNIYTSTVYDKGAEVVRMLRTLVGANVYDQGCDLYFARHQGQAVCCWDFVKAHADAANLDMEQFKLWYNQAGTPTVTASWTHNPATNTLVIKLEQHLAPTPGQSQKDPMVIPVRIGLVSGDAKTGDLDINGLGTDVTLLLDAPEKFFVINDVPATAVPSLLREFSAPVNLNAPYTDDNLRQLMLHDSDGFNQWEAGHKLMLKHMLAQIDNAATGKPITVAPVITDVFREMITTPGQDKQIQALKMTLPGYEELSQYRTPINPEAIQKVETAFRRAIHQALETELYALYRQNDTGQTWSYDVVSVGRRAIKNKALFYLTSDETTRNPVVTILASAQYKTADNMTDRKEALEALMRMGPDTPHAKAAMDDFYQIFEKDELVIDSWFRMNGHYAGDKAAAKIIELAQHPAYKNPTANRMRALLGGLLNTPEAFHNKDGSGYALLAQQIIKIGAINPQAAARFVDAMDSFAQYEEPWKSKMKNSLLYVASQPNLPESVEDKLKTILGIDYPVKATPAVPVPNGP